MSERQNGSVKWFNQNKGFGFIVPDSGASEVFVHISALSGGQDSLNDNDKVSFIITDGKRGPQASDVELAD